MISLTEIYQATELIVNRWYHQLETRDDLLYQVLEHIWNSSLVGNYG